MDSTNWVLLLCATMMISVLFFFNMPHCTGKSLHWGSMYSKSKFH